jgi:uncharacterized protein
MQLLHFGDPQRPLLGVHHPAIGDRDAAVLICPPLGHEQVRSYRALRTLARQLAGEGFHVLRFDYTGQGDSAGRPQDADVAQWQRDARTALEELADLSGARRTTAVGLRLGGTIAATAGLRVDHLVLWDPVVSGRAHLAELDRMHAAMVVDPQRFVMPRQVTGNDRLGFVMPVGQRESIAGLDLLGPGRWGASRVSILASAVRPADALLRAALAERGLPATLTVVPEDAGWEALGEIEETLQPTALLRAVLRGVVEGMP